MYNKTETQKKIIRTIHQVSIKLGCQIDTIKADLNKIPNNAKLTKTENLRDGMKIFTFTEEIEKHEEN